MIRFNPGAGNSGLLTDLYQLTMLDTYLDRDMHGEAVFEFFSRHLPNNRNFLVAAGLEQLLDYLESQMFSAEEIAWLDASGRFTPKLIDYLANFRFSGTVRAMREGTVFFANEPIVQVIAPLPEAQLIETRLINLLHFQTMIASKAARSVLAAPGKLLVDFGLRRAHGAEAGLLAARATYVAGFSGSSTVLADAAFGIPSYGTMAHSFVQSHSSELAAFEHFARMYPDGSILLIDTYDTLAAARAVTDLASRLRTENVIVHGVRLDSGDLPSLAVEVRKILDEGGCEDISIFCSGSLDEFALERDFRDTPVDGFGIGTRLDVSADAPYLDCAYKIQEYAGQAKRKKSVGKETWPGRKQVYRSFNDAGQMVFDTLALIDETSQGSPLLEVVMRDGQRTMAPPPLDEVRSHAAAGLHVLPEGLRQITGRDDYAVNVSSGIRALAGQLDRAPH